MVGGTLVYKGYQYGKSFFSSKKMQRFARHRARFLRAGGRVVLPSQWMRLPLAQNPQHHVYWHLGERRAQSVLPVGTRFETRSGKVHRGMTRLYGVRAARPLQGGAGIAKNTNLRQDVVRIMKELQDTQQYRSSAQLSLDFEVNALHRMGISTPIDVRTLKPTQLSLLDALVSNSKPLRGISKFFYHHPADLIVRL